MRMLKYGALLCAGFILPGLATPALAASAQSCPKVTGDVVLSARTPEVDLYDAPNGARVMTLEKDKFPACMAITARAPNMMLQINMDGTAYWVPPHMVKYHFAGALPAVCRNLAMGTNETKAGATRGLGEGCPKPGAQ